MKNNVSVVIPMYNASATICRALVSIENQTAQVDEVIIIDDGSTDDSLSLVRSFAKKSLLNIIIKSQPNGGVSKARNSGIAVAKFKYIAFLDSDDEWIAEKIELQLPYFNDHKVVLVGGNYLPVVNNSKPKERVISVRQQLIRNHFQTSTVIVRREIINRFGGFDETQKYAEEGRFYFDLLKFGQLVLLERQLVIYDGGNKRGFGHSGLSANIKAMHKGELRNFEYAKKLHRIPLISYYFYYSFSYLKYIKRYIQVSLIDKIM
ncbi:glycosyltransferase family A protein [Vibrio parahaemolyticus]|uniref:glycosyltransferase family 2 protein n=2 Tax=Vibrio parahaemolyticus TaxID=670 RepID=UPI000A383AF0|nr:glycosyltransferase family A protein [Vibrio parahaemolyticus]EHH2567859.1 glycosyltransferase family 2 protein [Vibrio parahaemolyticus]OUJ36392.1 hypothetical protein BTR40_10825 [Vibrio parahaemolyticus]